MLWTVFAILLVYLVLVINFQSWVDPMHRVVAATSICHNRSGR